jgi:hypothetical protein
MGKNVRGDEKEKNGEVGIIKEEKLFQRIIPGARYR